MLSFYEFFNILENQKRKNIAEAFDLNAAKARKAAQALADLQKKASGGNQIEPPAAPPEYNPPAPATPRYETQPDSLSRTEAPAPDKTKSPAKEVRPYGNISKLDARMPITGMKDNRVGKSKNMRVALPSEKGKNTQFQPDSAYVSWFNGVIKNIGYRAATDHFIKQYHLENSIRLVKKQRDINDNVELMLQQYKSMPEKPFFLPVDNLEKPRLPEEGLSDVSNDILLIDRDTLNHLIDEVIEYFNVREKQNAIEHTESLEQKLQNDAMSETDPDKKAIFDLAFLMSKNIFNKKIKNLLDEDGFMVKETFAEKLKEESIQNLTQKLNMIHNNMKSNTPSDTEYPNDIDADKEEIKRNALDKYKRVFALDALNK